MRWVISCKTYEPPPRLEEEVVIVEEAHNEWHARLAAYYHLWGTGGLVPTKSELEECTTVLSKEAWIVNASRYRDPQELENAATTTATQNG